MQQAWPFFSRSSCSSSSNMAPNSALRQKANG
jgi:hypothetical protein